MTNVRITINASTQMSSPSGGGGVAYHVEIDFTGVSVVSRVAGVDTNITTLLGASDPDYYGSAGYDPGQIDGDGYNTELGGSLYPAALGPLYDAIVVDGKALIMEFINSNATVTPIYIAHILDEDVGINLRGQLALNQLEGNIQIGAQVGAERNLWYATLGSTNRMAAVFSADRTDVSFNGNDDLEYVPIEDSEWSETLNAVFLGYGGDITILRILVVDAPSAGGLAALSAGGAEGLSIPVIAVEPVISGVPADGEDIVCSTGGWVGGGTITYAYQWRRDGADITDETVNTYTLVTEDVETSIDCVVTASNAAGSANFPATAVMIAGVPANTVLPVLLGDTFEDGFLGVGNDGTWTGGGTMVFTYQWKRDGVDIPGETTGSRQIVTADVGTVLACTVIATNEAGSSSATTENSEIITGAP